MVLIKPNTHSNILLYINQQQIYINVLFFIHIFRKFFVMNSMLDLITSNDLLLGVVGNKRDAPSTSFGLAYLYLFYITLRCVSYSLRLNTFSLYQLPDIPHYWSHIQFNLSFKMNKIIFFILIMCLKEVLLDSCEKHLTCRECIRDSSVCDWCASVSIYIYINIQLYITQQKLENGSTND